MRHRNSPQWKIARTISVSLLLLGIALMPMVSPFAQKRKEGPYRITGVSSRKTASGTIVTVAADAPLTRTQTWQDEEGFHMSLPDASPGSIGGLPRGVTVRNLGKSLEIVVAVKPGAGVTVDPQSNRLNLIVNGNVDGSQGGAQLEPPSRKSRAEESAEPSYEYTPPVRQPREARLPGAAAPAESLPSGREFVQPQSAASAQFPPNAQGAGAAPNGLTPAAPTAAAPPSVETTQQLVPAAEQGIVPPGETPASQEPAVPPQMTITTQESGGIFSYLFSFTGVLVLLLVGFLALMVVRKRQNNEASPDLKEEKSEELALEVIPSALPSLPEERPKKERRKWSRRKSDQALVKPNVAVNPEAELVIEKGPSEKRVVAPVQPALFGAYRVDQEVGKLVLGQPHRLDVLSSRAPDDRRAIETSLLKALNSPEAGEEGQRKAREALEEYGFVARQCASLLLAHNAYDRASSARVLGDIGAQSSMPFLLEALYDSETIVRTEAVSSLGALKMPSAIGALLDMSRRHPEIPSALITKALNACTFDCLDIFDSSMPALPLLEAGDDFAYTGEITHLDPAAAVEELPEWFEDEELSEALARLQETDVEARASAARRLAQFHVQRSVEALAAIAANDPESVVRAAAVTSLGEIEHETVFAPVIVAFGDEAREVRAAAARSLSRMSFDRAEGYVRLIETADALTLQKVAQACIKAGMVGQAIDRLISEDRRLAYEAFSLISLLAKSGEVEPLVDAICEHPEVNVRLALIRLLGTTGEPAIATTLRHLAVRDGLPEKVRSALLEIVYKMDQTADVRS
ncbi:MAG TPA: HEAT repeat domain-containing protein [Pyrinomonadaceae bacterium]